MPSSGKSIAIGLIIGLVIGILLGYIAAPKGEDTSELEQQINQLEQQVADLQSQLESKNEQISSLQSQVEELESLIPPLRKGEWNTIITFTGSTGKTTELFHIPSGTWRINWTYTGGELAVFGFFVYPEGETVMYVETLTTMGPSQSDTTYIYEGPGNFYIKLSATNIEEWALTIEAFVPE